MIATRYNEMNDENLISLADRTPEEREEIARKGAKASAESKREKKILSGIYGEIIAEIYGVDCEEGTSIKDIVKSVFEAVVNTNLPPDYVQVPNEAIVTSPVLEVKVLS